MEKGRERAEDKLLREGGVELSAHQMCLFILLLLIIIIFLVKEHRYDAWSG